MPFPINGAVDGWTTPRTWTAGEVVAASDLQEIRDDFNSLGAAWRGYTAPLSNFAGTQYRASYSQAGDHIVVDYRCTISSVTSFMAVGIPFTAVASYVGGAGGDVIGRAIAYDVSAGTYTLGAVIFNTGSTSNIAIQNPTGPATWNATTPFTWAAGDILSFRIRYEAA